MKTLKKIVNASVCVCVVMAATSCEDFLELPPARNQIESAQVFESVHTADAALRHLYSELQASSLISGGNTGAGALLGSYTDELISYNVFIQNENQDIYNNIQGPSNSTVKKVWANAYEEIYIANAILEGVGKSHTIPTADRDRIRGEALFIRSLLHFYLNQLYGDVPYVTSTGYAVNATLAKTEYSAMLNLLQQDFMEAARLLQDAYRSTERVYANRKSAELMAALVMITRKDFASAEPLLRGIVSSSLYQWQPDLSKTFKKDSRNIIWQLKPLNMGDATNEALLYYFIDTVPVTYTLSPDLVNSFHPQDKRLYQWVTQIEIDSQLYFRPAKYTNTVENDDEYSVVFRLEEVYLLLAECLLHQNKKAEALTYLNAVKEKAGIPPLSGSASGETVFAEITVENRHEFFTERGIRFLSLKRSDRLQELALTKPNWQPFHRQWPLPLSELILNPQLKPQNEGY